jgi:hypothetical protein
MTSDPASSDLHQSLRRWGVRRRKINLKMRRTPAYLRRPLRSEQKGTITSRKNPSMNDSDVFATGARVVDRVVEECAGSTMISVTVGHSMGTKRSC